MKKTEHYRLSQWEYPDRILMSDFNSDNAKIDAALASEASARQAAIALHPSAELLAGLTVEIAMKKVELDVSRVDWNRYFLVLLEVESTTTKHLYLSAGLKGELSTFFQTGHSIYNYLAAGFQCNRLAGFIPVLYSGNRRPLLMTFADSSDGTYSAFTSGSAAEPLSNARKFTVTNESSFAPGDYVKIWGVK